MAEFGCLYSEVLLTRNAWEKRKLGELAEFINGRAYKQDELLASGKYPVLRVGNFYTNDKWYYSDLELPEKYYAEKGDLLYTWSATFGPHIWIGPKVIYHYHIWKVALKNLFEKDFALQFFEADRVRLLNSTNGSTMIHVTKKDMESKGILLPDISEQRNIGEFLRKADDLIAATQHKIDALEQTKKALLQRLFDQSWRFKGYSDPWEKRKLGEVATITMGQSPDSKNYTLNPQDHILVQGNADIKNGWVEPRVWTTQITKIAKKGSVLLSVRAPVGEVSKTAFDVVLGRGVASVGQTDFLYQYLITLKINGFWLRYSTGSTFDSINSADIKDAIIFLPKKNEQDRIAKTLNCIDSLIAATQSRLSSLELLKKALLQALFI
ncbi:restriction endonuclease subunit S [Lacticaseibacillus paracasei]|uniref:restriction endonuclease subunit S n=1 Tax=Lacticaseibacillus paracasei TaxID=1597 RepID=UPI000F0B31C5|nr:restriction endonuclease subunit S [Lacticaseibacillus paracasei]RNE07195.1 EcoKI restriction-modification system protein HsdS [Lacticaseibacillus paracasei]